MFEKFGIKCTTRACWAYQICLSDIEIYFFLFSNIKTKTKQVKLMLKKIACHFLVGEQAMDYTHNA